MRHAACSLLLLAGIAAADEGVSWGTSFEEAARSKRPVLALFWAEW